jgi:phosphopentomutase
MIDRVIILIFDSLGIGELPDAEAYGDAGANTLANLAAAVGGMRLPVLAELGLGNIADIPGVAPAAEPLACYGKMAEKSHGKDTTVGLWEMMGLITVNPFPVFPGGFPPDVIGAFEHEIGCPIIGNKAASGTEIIEELGPEHMRTGRPIVYTSADSVFQIAAHEDVVPTEKLYDMCMAARGILKGSLGVDRVIARPFTGRPGSFVRTEKRKDFGLPPTGKMVLDYAAEAGVRVVSIGKVWDVFSGRGIKETVKTKNNKEAFAKTTERIREGKPGIVFTILGDFDTLWGHRDDIDGYAKGLLEADSSLKRLLKALKESDVLLIAADHGCDPTFPGTDHTREYVPLLMFGEGLKNGVNVGVRMTFADAGRTVAEILGFPAPVSGISFAKDILKS